MDEKLKSCPFCKKAKAKAYELGSFGLVNEKPIVKLFHVMCKNCRCQTDIYRRIGWAIKAWNRRIK